MDLNVLYQFNEKYAPFAGVSITSLFENNKDMEAISVFILGEDLSHDSRARIRRLSADYGRRVCFMETAPLVSMMKKMEMPSYRGSYAANMRLFLPLVLDPSIERVLYLDADTIVAGSLGKLASLDMKGHPLAMCLDSLVRKHKKDLGFDAADFYYNSGVILFDMVKFRERHCSERIADHVRNVRAWYPSPDQDLLNVVLKGEIMKLPAKYNIQPVYLAFGMRSYYRTFGKKGFYAPSELWESLADPVIYHFFRFIGEFPWHKGNVHPDNDIFDSYAAMSPWGDYVKQPSGAGLVLKIEKVLYRVLPRGVFIRIFRRAYEMFIKRANSDSLKRKKTKLM